ERRPSHPIGVTVMATQFDGNVTDTTGGVPNRGTQPVIASAIRAVDRLAELGETVDAGLRDALAALGQGPPGEVEGGWGKLLARYELVELRIGPHGPESAAQLGEPARLVQGGWRSFLIRTVNPGAVQSEFTPAGGGSLVTTASGMVTRPYLPDKVEYASTIRDEWWYEVQLDGRGVLSGCEREFYVLSVYSRDAGQLSAPIMFSTPAAPDWRFARGDGWERTQYERTWIAGVAQ